MSVKKPDGPILSVSQLTQAIKLNLEMSFPSIWLQGEISNSKLHSSGHFYFSIKDSQSQIAAIMFRAHVATLKPPPKDGDNVIVYGSLNVYPQSGKYQIIVTELRLAGLGELLLRLEQLKRKLHEKGWFNKIHKKTIPKMPRRIGVVTSPTGAAIQDILNILTRRFSGFHLILNPVRVQGEGAANEIAQAIRQFNETNLVDVIIVGRGGGSIEDLWAFNEEVVAEAIFHSHIPIIAAVGHETDHCIAEYIADVRAPTPSAAAEIVIAEKAHQIEIFQQTRLRLEHSISIMLRNTRRRLETFSKQQVFRNPYVLLGPWMQKLDDARHHIDLSIGQTLKQHQLLLQARKKILYNLNPKAQIQNSKLRIRTIAKQLDQLVLRRVVYQSERLSRVSSAMKSIDPKNLLARGYSILFSEKDRSVITSVRHVTYSDRLRILLSDGEITSTVQEIIQKNGQ